MQVSRRRFLQVALAAGAVMTAEGLWMPGEKLISIPSKKIFIPDGRLAWVEDGSMWMFAGGRHGGKTEIPTYFNVEVRGAEIDRKSFDFIRSHGELAHN